MTDQGQYYQPQNQPSGAPGPAGDGRTGAGRGTKRPVSVGQILGGLLFVLVIVFIIENSRQVKIRLIIPEGKAPLDIVVLLSAVLGSAITGLRRYRRHRTHPKR